VEQASHQVTNPVAVETHVHAVPLVVSRNPVWDQSADRADAVRALLEAEGMSATRIARTTAHADREPVSANLLSERNNRVEIVFLRSAI
jgi:chemotaxis protein MotB